MEGVMSTDILQMMQLGLLILAKLLGLMFSIGGLTRKPAAA
jgi:hypothetical protein